MKLSVIIVNYNVKHFLEQCLHAALKACEKLDTEVFVVDNNSVDGSCQMVREKFPQVTLVENKENVGFSKANNQAIRLAKGEYVLLLNPDTVVEEDSFTKICSFMDEHPEAGGLGVKMIDGKGHFLPESKRGLPTPKVAFYKITGLSKLFPKSKEFSRYHLGHLDKEQVHEIEILSGAFMLMRKKHWMKLACWTRIILCTAKTSTSRTVLCLADIKITITRKQPSFITKEKALKRAVSTM